MGAVAYDAKVVTIWDGFQRYFARHGLDFDYVLYSNYERQVEAHCRGHIHLAWNSPLAWVDAQACDASPDVMCSGGQPAFEIVAILGPDSPLRKPLP